MKNTVNFLVLLSAIVCVSCTSTRNLDVIGDDFVEYVLEENQGFLVVYRGERGLGSAIKFPVLVDNKLVGEIGVNSYIKIPLDAGTHKLSSFNEYEQPSQDFEMKPGITVYFKNVKNGAFDSIPKVNFDRVDEAIANDQVRGLQRIATGEYASLNYYKRSNTVPDDKAILYVYRPMLSSHHTAQFQTPLLKLNGREVAQLNPGQFLELVVDAGDYEASLMSKKMIVNFDLRKGSIGYLRIHSSSLKTELGSLWELEFLGDSEPVPEILPTISVGD